MYVSAIVVAAGLSLRLKSNIPKPLVKINSRPVIIFSLSCLAKCRWVKEIIVVANARNMQGIKKAIRQYKIPKVSQIVFGGVERKDSAYNGIRAASPQADLILIHDGGRPFISQDIISRAVNQAQKSGAAIAAVPVKATIKKVRGKNIVEKTIDRENLWEIQTPQVFRKALIREAFKRFGHLEVTDDAILVEKMGKRVSIVWGDYKNIKITTPEDLIIAKALAKNAK